jgi:hypothetical protein
VSPEQYFYLIFLHSILIDRKGESKDNLKTKLFSIFLHLFLFLLVKLQKVIRKTLSDPQKLIAEGESLKQVSVFRCLFLAHRSTFGRFASKEHLLPHPLRDGHGRQGKEMGMKV